MKTSALILLIIAMTASLGQAQECTLMLSKTLIPKDFFDRDNYTSSFYYEPIFTSHRWLSLYGDYDNCTTSIGGYRLGNYIEFDNNGRFCIFNGTGKFQTPPIVTARGDYKFNTFNGLLYMRWDRSKDKNFEKGIVCKICYFVAKKNNTRYKEALQMYHYVGATWDMPVEKIETYRTIPLFETFVRYKTLSVIH